MANSPSSAPSVEAPPRRIGREEPRIWTPPLGDLTPKTSAGFECITFAEEVLGITLFPWQKWLLIHALELLGDGTYRFRTVIVLVARQNGKSTLMQILSLWRMFVDGAPLVIGTAQNLDVAEEQWQGAIDIAEGIPELDAEIAQKSLVNGKKFIRLIGGERYKVATASRKGGRGLSGDLILLDELREHQNWESWGSVTKTTMARERAQVWAASNAGDRTSVVLGFLRRLTHAALGNPDGIELGEVRAEGQGVADEDLPGIFEWSAVPGCDIWDRDGWAQANPSLGLPNGITERAIASAARTDPEDVYRTEVLCQWVDDLAGDQVIPLDMWTDARNDKLVPSDGVCYSIDASPDLKSAVIAVSDGHSVRVMEHHEGVFWLPAMLDDVLTERPGEVWLDPRGPVNFVLVELEECGIEWHEITAQEHAQACGGLLAAVLSGRGFSHAGQSPLDAAVAGATRRPYGDAWAWNRIKSSVDICPLVAVTIARWAALQAAETKPDPALNVW